MYVFYFNFIGNCAEKYCSSIYPFSRHIFPAKITITGQEAGHIQDGSQIQHRNIQNND